ncbi:MULTISPECIES: nSTAND1 domain-containing NTPase [Aliiglaciecola]|uniref:nSTAND1 domain-containing NTPase n=1 Tax=Aliiglaciecola TaxID=1406885 RepID=UPI001C0A3F12|nr:MULTISPECIES: hypothetical protein [Aliiglaciecola]MBU2877695.1 hypothetical protein [Aliiglaciecola lipolytica]MDO6713094.1 hypothetical protein [Aliiglaciecola sp. 2_MG-2023]MDO6754140.1 hypothetical protein [Aliiglaciecola sp. 1_MG-2023]
MESENRNNDNPFVGLNAFEISHTDNFQGREDVVQQALSKLQHKALSSQPFLLLLGKSGAGKSSLLQAGIFPKLDELQFGEQNISFRSTIITPCNLSIDPFRSLILALSDISEQDFVANQELNSLVKMCKQQPDKFLQMMKQKMESWPADKKLAIGIVQLERLFLTDSLGYTERRYFTDILAGLVIHCGILVVATLRSDFYHTLSDYPALLRLKQNGGQLDVLPPTLNQLKKMVFPGTAKHLKFEQANGELVSLDEYIAQRAFEFPDSLPLLQFVLFHLHQNRSQNGLINYSTYRNLGGLERAIAKITEQTYESLDRSCKKHFNRTVSRLAELNYKGHYERVWVKADDLYKSHNAKELIDAFEAIGIMKSVQGIDGNNYICLVHDCLFANWPRLSEALDHHQKTLELKNKLEAQAAEWKSATRPSAYLLAPGKALDEGKLILKQSGSISSTLRAMIHASVKRASLKYRVGFGFAVLLLMLFGFMIKNAYDAKVNQKIAESKLIESHELIEFLIDESTKLEAIGRLDLIQESSERSLEYLSTVSPSDDSTAAKLSRSQTFFQLGKVYLENRQFAGALDAFNKTLELDTELVEIHPNGFTYVLELAHANYWIAMTHLRAGDIQKAEQYFLFYQTNAHDLVELQPDSPIAKIELSRAYSNLAKIAAQRGQLESATQSFFEAVKFTEKGRSAANISDLLEAASAYTWLANKYYSELKIAESLEMNKGEQRLRSLIIKKEDSPANQMAAAYSLWKLANEHILVGQYKQADSALSELKVACARGMRAQNADIQWRYLDAFSDASLAQMAMLSGNSEQARKLFSASFGKVGDTAAGLMSQWQDAFFERQYWLARFHHGNANQKGLESASSVIINANQEDAIKWKVRLATLVGEQVDFEVMQSDEILKPQMLIAALEYYSFQDHLEKLQRLWQQVPQEMWLNKDLEELRDTLRKQIREFTSQ